MNLNLKTLSDEELMSLLAQGETLSFDELYSRHSGKTYGFILQKTKNEMKASDLHQITWEKVYTKCHTFDPNYKFTSWVFQISYNAIIDDQRNELRKYKLIDRLKETNKIENQIVDFDLNLNDLKIDQLKSPYKEALTMRYSEGLDISTIAEKINVKEANARKILSRGLKMLKKAFTEQKYEQ